jgi:hypothetical protein
MLPVTRIRWAAGGVAALVLSSLAPAAHADSAAAEALFREALELMNAKKYGEACPKLAESNRQDPASGTLLALALCYERADKTASAWAAYAEAASRARVEKRSDREAAATKRIHELEKKISKLSVVVPDAVKDTPGLSIRRDGEVLGDESWNVAMPVDPGKHHVTASAEGYQSFEVDVTVGGNADRKVLQIAALEKAESDGAPPPPLPPPKHDEPKGSGNASLQTVGLVTGALGVVGLGVGTYFGISAISKNSDSKNGCDGNSCDEAGYQARSDARSAGNVATIGFVAGGVLLAAGVTLYVVGAPSKTEQTAVRVAPALGPGVYGGAFRGTF